MAEIGLRYPRRPVAGRRRTFTARLSVFMPHDDEALRGYDAATWAPEGPVSYRLRPWRLDLGGYALYIVLYAYIQHYMEVYRH